MTKFDLRLKPETIQKLQEIADKENRSRSSVGRIAIEAYVALQDSRVALTEDLLIDSFGCEKVNESLWLHPSKLFIYWDETVGFHKVIDSVLFRFTYVNQLETFLRIINTNPIKNNLSENSDMNAIEAAIEQVKNSDYSPSMIWASEPNTNPIKGI